MREVYKVVAIKDKKRLSAMAHLGLPDKLIIRHPAKRWVKPKVGKIFCFDTLPNALALTTNALEFEIWRCKAKGIRTITTSIELFDLTHIRNFMDVVIEFWAGIKSIEALCRLDPLLSGVPKGTLVARTIKLEQRVYSTEQN